MKRLIAHLLIAAALCGADPPVLWETTGAIGTERAVVVDSRYLSIREATRLTKIFLDGRRGEIISRYIIATNAEDGLTNLRGIGVTDKTFPDWRQAYLNYLMPIPATAEAVRLTHRTAIRFRRADGRLVVATLGSRSPYEIDFRGESLRLISIALLRTSCPDQGGETVEMFIQTPTPWSRGTAEEFTRFMSREIGSHCIVLHLRDDPWFGGAYGYPAYNRFLPFAEPPTIGSFKQHRTIYCTGGDGRCT